MLVASQCDFCADSKFSWFFPLAFLGPGLFSQINFYNYLDLA